MISKFDIGMARLLMLACDADARKDTCSAAAVYADTVLLSDAAGVYSECINKYDELMPKE
jgi:hypothetical protein